MAKLMIFSNEFSEKVFEETKQALIEAGIDNPSDNDIFDVIEENNDLAFCNVKSELERIICNHEMCIAVGSQTRWNGTHFGFSIVSSIDDIVNLLWHCDEFEIYDENGHLYFSGSDHDESVCFELRSLNERGKTYYERWNNSFNDKRTATEVWKKLASVNYSNSIKYFKENL